jgi:hypothetical protein
VNNKDLKPCPFCGATYIVYETEESESVWLPYKARVVCSSCCAKSQWTWGLDEDRAKVKAQMFWNQRAHEPKDPKEEYTIRMLEAIQEQIHRAEFSKPKRIEVSPEFIKAINKERGIEHQGVDVKFLVTEYGIIPVRVDPDLQPDQFVLCRTDLITVPITWERADVEDVGYYTWKGE